MTRRFPILKVLMAMALAGSAGFAAANSDKDKAAIFPELEGSNLEGKKFVLPKDFEGELNLTLIAFLREQQALVDTWLPLARSLQDRYEGFRYYELPTIYRANPAYRWFINTGMRRGIKDPEARAATITLYLDKKKFRSSLQLPHEGTIYALLVDKRGRVVWRVEGALSKAKQKDLEVFLSKALESRGD